MRYAWVGGRCNWVSEDGCFALDLAFKADRIGNMLGACDYIFMHEKTTSTLAVGSRCNWDKQVGLCAIDLNLKNGSGGWILGA